MTKNDPMDPMNPMNPVDPIRAWRDWFVRSEREWSEGLTRLMQDDNVARNVGQQIHAGLYKQQMLTQGMAAPLALMNMPTREDVTALSNRIGQLEDAVARMEAQLARLAPPAAPRPARTRKAPATRAAR